MSLTPTQLQTLKTGIANETDPEFVGYRNAGATGAMKDWLNKPSTFYVQRTNVRTSEIGPQIVYTTIGEMTSTNQQRLTIFLDLNPDSFVPTSDIQAMFADIFSGTLGGGGAQTRANLTALWERLATRAEKYFATGTGTSASPGTAGWEGFLTEYDVVQATTQV